MCHLSVIHPSLPLQMSEYSLDPSLESRMSILHQIKERGNVTEAAAGWCCPFPLVAWRWCVVWCCRKWETPDRSLERPLRSVGLYQPENIQSPLWSQSLVPWCDAPDRLQGLSPRLHSDFGLVVHSRPGELVDLWEHGRIVRRVHTLYPH